MKGAYSADAATSAHAVFIGVAKNRRNAVILIETHTQKNFIPSEIIRKAGKRLGLPRARRG